MPPARCLGRRWKLSNDEYGFIVWPLTIGNSILLALHLAVLPVAYHHRNGFVFCACLTGFVLLYDLVLCRWSRRGYINDVEGKRRGLSFALGVRFLLLVGYAMSFYYDLVFWGAFGNWMRKADQGVDGLSSKFGWNAMVCAAWRKGRIPTGGIQEDHFCDVHSSVLYTDQPLVSNWAVRHLYFWTTGAKKVSVKLQRHVTRCSSSDASRGASSSCRVIHDQERTFPLVEEQRIEELAPGTFRNYCSGKAAESQSGPNRCHVLTRAVVLGRVVPLSRDECVRHDCHPKPIALPVYDGGRNVASRTAWAVYDDVFLEDDPEYAAEEGGENGDEVSRTTGTTSSKIEVLLRADGVFAPFIYGVLLLYTLASTFVALVAFFYLSDRAVFHEIEEEEKFRKKLLDTILLYEDTDPLDRKRFYRLSQVWLRLFSFLFKKVFRLNGKTVHLMLRNILGWNGSHNLTVGDVWYGLKLVAGERFGGRLPVCYKTPGVLLDADKDLEEIDFLQTYIQYAWIAYGIDKFDPRVQSELEDEGLHQGVADAEEAPGVVEGKTNADLPAQLYEEDVPIPREKTKRSSRGCFPDSQQLCGAGSCMTSERGRTLRKKKKRVAAKMREYPEQDKQIGQAALGNDCSDQVEDVRCGDHGEQEVDSGEREAKPLPQNKDEDAMRSAMGTGMPACRSGSFSFCHRFERSKSAASGSRTLTATGRSRSRSGRFDKILFRGGESSIAQRKDSWTKKSSDFAPQRSPGSAATRTQSLQKTNSISRSLQRSLSTRRKLPNPRNSRQFFNLERIWNRLRRHQNVEDSDHAKNDAEDGSGATERGFDHFGRFSHERITRMHSARDSISSSIADVARETDTESQEDLHIGEQAARRSFQGCVAEAAAPVFTVQHNRHASRGSEIENKGTHAASNFLIEAATASDRTRTRTQGRPFPAQISRTRRCSRRSSDLTIRSDQNQGRRSGAAVGQHRGNNQRQLDEHEQREQDALLKRAIVGYRKLLKIREKRLQRRYPSTMHELDEEGQKKRQPSVPTILNYLLGRPPEKLVGVGGGVVEADAEKDQDENKADRTSASAVTRNKDKLDETPTTVVTQETASPSVATQAGDGTTRSTGESPGAADGPRARETCFGKIHQDLAELQKENPSSMQPTLLVDVNEAAEGCASALDDVGDDIVEELKPRYLAEQSCLGATMSTTSSPSCPAATSPLHHDSSTSSLLGAGTASSVTTGTDTTLETRPTATACDESEGALPSVSEKRSLASHSISCSATLEDQQGSRSVSLVATRSTSITLTDAGQLRTLGTRFHFRKKLVDMQQPGGGPGGATFSSLAMARWHAAIGAVVWRRAQLARRAEKAGRRASTAEPGQSVTPGEIKKPLSSDEVVPLHAEQTLHDVEQDCLVPISPSTSSLQADASAGHAASVCLSGAQTPAATSYASLSPRCDRDGMGSLGTTPSLNSVSRTTPSENHGNDSGPPTRPSDETKDRDADPLAQGQASPTQQERVDEVDGQQRSPREKKRLEQTDSDTPDTIELLHATAQAIGGEHCVSYAALDHFSSALVIAFRGTAATQDAATMASYHPKKLSEDGPEDEMVNGSFLDCAEYALNEISYIIDELINAGAIAGDPNKKSGDLVPESSSRSATETKDDGPDTYCYPPENLPDPTCSAGEESNDEHSDAAEEDEFGFLHEAQASTPVNKSFCGSTKINFMDDESETHGYDGPPGSSGGLDRVPSFATSQQIRSIADVVFELINRKRGLGQVQVAGQSSNTNAPSGSGATTFTSAQRLGPAEEVAARTCHHDQRRTGGADGQNKKTAPMPRKSVLGSSANASGSTPLSGGGSITASGSTSSQQSQQLLRRPTYKVVVTGHSLGAGVACVFGLLLSRRYPWLKDCHQLRCLLVAPPAFACSAKLAEESERFMLTIVNGCDVIPRLTVEGCIAYRNYYLSVLAKAKMSKYDVNMITKEDGKPLPLALPPRLCSALHDLLHVCNTARWNKTSPYNIFHSAQVAKLAGLATEDDLQVAALALKRRVKKNRSKFRALHRIVFNQNERAYYKIQPRALGVVLRKGRRGVLLTFPEMPTVHNKVYVTYRDILRYFEEVEAGGGGDRDAGARGHNKLRSATEEPNEDHGQDTDTTAGSNYERRNAGQMASSLKLSKASGSIGDANIQLLPSTGESAASSSASPYEPNPMYEGFGYAAEFSPKINGDGQEQNKYGPFSSCSAACTSSLGDQPWSNLQPSLSLEASLGVVGRHGETGVSMPYEQNSDGAKDDVDSAAPMRSVRPSAQQASLKPTRKSTGQQQLQKSMTIHSRSARVELLEGIDLADVFLEMYVPERTPGRILHFRKRKTEAEEKRIAEVIANDFSGIMEELCLKAPEERQTTQNRDRAGANAEDAEARQPLLPGSRAPFASSGSRRGSFSSVMVDASSWSTRVLPPPSATAIWSWIASYRRSSLVRARVERRARENGLVHGHTSSAPAALSPEEFHHNNTRRGTRDDSECRERSGWHKHSCSSGTDLGVTQRLRSSDQLHQGVPHCARRLSGFYSDSEANTEDCYAAQLRGHLPQYDAVWVPAAELRYFWPTTNECYIDHCQRGNEIAMQQVLQEFY